MFDHSADHTNDYLRYWLIWFIFKNHNEQKPLEGLQSAECSLLR